MKFYENAVKLKKNGKKQRYKRIKKSVSLFL